MSTPKTKNSQKEVYMDPFTDYGFKKLFGEEDSKEYLKDFLNSVFGDFIPKIKELNYHKTEYLGNKPIDRNVVFDLYCKSPEGNSFIIELQKAKQQYFKQRSLFYSTFAITEQGLKGEWDFKLNPVYCISILDFTLDNDNNKKYITKVKLLDIETHKTVIEELNFAFIECPKFNKNINKNSSKQDKWLYVLTHLSHLQNLPPELSEKLFEDFFAKANILKLPSEEKGRYNASIAYHRDIHNIQEQNFAKGKAEGKNEGIVEGEKKANIENAKRMKTDNLPIETIAKYTGLTIKEINSL